MIVEFGLPAQIYGVGFSILMVFGHKQIVTMIMMGFLVCVFFIAISNLSPAAPTSATTSTAKSAPNSTTKLATSSATKSTT